MEQLKLFDPDRPIERVRSVGACSYESKMIETKGGGKSLCEVMGLWTNCREVNYCVAEKAGRLEHGD